jgi:hypothetical protein
MRLSSVAARARSSGNRPQVAVTEGQHTAGDLGPGVILVRAVSRNDSALAFARGLQGGIITASAPVPVRPTRSAIRRRCW